jgi:hypothetical protein
MVPDNCEEECLSLIGSMDLGLTKEKTEEARKDAIKACNESRSQSHICRFIMQTIQKWVYYGNSG